jgi:hypothetical protein
LKSQSILALRVGTSFRIRTNIHQGDNHTPDTAH